MKEIKVKLYAYENDSFVELWKTINPKENEPKYFGRYTYMDEGTWYYVSDPLGYCELSHAVENDVMFVLCDEKGNEYCRYSNADKNPLPKFETVMKRKWQEVCKNILHNAEDETKNFWIEAIYGETTLEINQWLLTFKDPDLYKKEIDSMYGYDENWLYCRNKEVKYDAIPETEFDYLGRKYQFTKVTMQHEVCGTEWVEFVCTDAPYQMEDFSWDKNKTYIRRYGNMGNWFDKSKTGAMIDRRSAKKMVYSALLKVYPKESEYSKLFHVKDSYCYKVSYMDVAEQLIDGDLHKVKILELIENLSERTHNIVFTCTNENKQKIKTLYPNIYGCDYCLI